MVRPSRVRTRLPLGFDPKTVCGASFSAIACHDTSFQFPMRLTGSAANMGLEIVRRITSSVRMVFLRKNSMNVHDAKAAGRCGDALRSVALSRGSGGYGLAHRAVTW